LTKFALKLHARCMVVWFLQTLKNFCKIKFGKNFLQKNIY